MKRRGFVVIGLMVLLAALLLTGCGGGDDDADNEQEATEITPSVVVTPGGPPTATPRPTNTPVPAAPRQKSVPNVAEPYDLELPPSVGAFFRITQRGKASLTQTGGLQATYRREEDEAVVVVTAYYFEHMPDAGATVEFTLGSSSIVNMIEALFKTPAVTYGIGQNRQNGHIAAWSNYNWAYVISTSESLDVLNDFITPFPY